MTPEFKTSVDDLRREIGDIEIRVHELAQHEAFSSGAPEGSPNADPGEMISNIVLAFRHLEDGRMRLGKVLQATEGGVSIYDRKPGSDAAVPTVDRGTDDSPNDNLPSRLR